MHFNNKHCFSIVRIDHRKVEATMKIHRSERGQALAEYMPLIPPVLLLSVLILMPLADHTSDIFCRMVNTMEPEKCVVTDIDVDEEPTPEPEEEPICVPLQEEEGGSQCDQSGDCDVLPGVNKGYYDATDDIQTFVIKAGKGYHKYYAGETNDTCYAVNINGNHVEWERVGKGKNCKDISHTQSWRSYVCDKGVASYK
jgi:hypothetical protein